jgi:hypothetical protein
LIFSEPDKALRGDNNTERWLNALAGKVLVAGYGSLLSSSSREIHSQLFVPTLPVFISGWQRSWVTRSYHEKQTYAGAIQQSGAGLNAQLIPTNIDVNLAAREKDYRFVRVDSSQLSLPEVLSTDARLRESLKATPVYICETLDRVTADQHYPVSFSYIATCLAGAQEADPDNGIRDFLQHTHGWDKQHIDIDIDVPKYPRLATMSAAQAQAFLAALQDYSIL